MTWSIPLELQVLEEFASCGLHELGTERQAIQDGLDVYHEDHWKPSRVVVREHRQRRLADRPPCPACGRPPAEPRTPRNYPVYCSKACAHRTQTRRRYHDRYDDPNGPRSRHAARNVELKAARHERPRPQCAWCQSRPVYGRRSDCLYCSDKCRHDASNHARADRKRASRRAP